MKTLLNKSFIFLIIFNMSIIFLIGCSNKPKNNIKLNGINYSLTFYDDFNGNSLNENNWELCPEMNRQDVGGKWSDSMTSLDGNGNLILKANIDQNNTPVSGAIRTKGKFEQAKGYFEICCKLQSQSGFWSAFWLMCDGQLDVGNGAVDGAEIDIFEAYDVVNGNICNALHWDGYDEHHKKRQTLPKPIVMMASIIHLLFFGQTKNTFSISTEMQFTP